MSGEDGSGDQHRLKNDSLGLKFRLGPWAGRDADYRIALSRRLPIALSDDMSTAPKCHVISSYSTQEKARWTRVEHVPDPTTS